MLETVLSHLKVMIPHKYNLQSTKHCFEKWNKNDRSPFSFKSYDEPILLHLGLYSC